MSVGVLDLMLADARTPSGGYAHSGGLEAAGIDAAAVPGFIRARLGTVGLVDAAFAAAATRVASVAGALELDAEWAARTPSPALRRAARQLGRGLLRTGRIWFPDAPLLAGYAQVTELSPRPVVAGLLGGAGTVAPRLVARASLYEDAAGVAAAAVKLMPLDAAVASRWILELGEEIERLADAATQAVELPSTATPRLDTNSLTHSSNDRRLFVS